MKNLSLTPGVGGAHDAFTQLDLATGSMYCDPVSHKDTLETFVAIQYMRGDDNVRRMYSDNWPAIKKACKHLRIMWERSQPGVHQTNARIERLNAEIQAGARTLLFEAGLPSCFWTFAMPCFCFLANLQPDENGLSAWFKRHGVEFDGKEIPFGARVFFVPAPTKYERDKADVRLQCGLFFGYRLAPGGKWNNEYLVVDLEDFVDKDLSMRAPGTEFRVYPHVTKVVHLKSNETFFPLKETYDKVKSI